MIINKVIWWEVLLRSELQEFQWDLKLHDNEEQIEKLWKRILKRWFSAPIFIWKNGEINSILDWHQRLKWLKYLAEEHWEILENDKIPVVYIFAKNEQDARDTLLEYNSKYSEMDMSVLQQWYKDWDMEFLLIPEFSSLEEQVDEEAEKIEDNVPEVNPKNILVRKWDIYQLWEHRLMCGDSMDETYIEKLLEWRNENITHCISDPPYWIAYSPDSFEMIQNDDTILDYTLLAQKYTNWYFCMWTWYQVAEEWIQLVKKTFKKLTNMIIWHKGGWWMWDWAINLDQDFEILLVSNRDNKLATDYRWSATWYWNQEEKAEYLKKAKKEELKEILEKINLWQTIWKVWKDNGSEYLHPTQKPVEINERVLKNYTHKEDNVLDLFWWSWSNLIACEKIWRKMYMMELDEEYVQVIIKRYHDYTKWEKKIQCLTREVDINQITEW